jgi:3-methylcrotonyl-CoA carboxylase alpha subunit
MPGKVTRVFVEKGQQVEADTPLLALEAMKMEHTLNAPRAGVVSAVYFQPGELVDADAVLVKLDET